MITVFPKGKYKIKKHLFVYIEIKYKYSVHVCTKYYISGIYVSRVNPCRVFSMSCHVLRNIQNVHIHESDNNLCSFMQSMVTTTF